MDDEKNWLYHVRITRKSDPNHDLTRLDISRQELEERFLHPYREGRSIVIGGHTIPPDDLDHIRISRAEQPSAQVIQQLRAEDRMSSVIFVGEPSYEWRVADRGIDMTDELITGPPGGEDASTILQLTESPMDKSVVFVVHGRNLAARDAMFAFLRSIGLRPLEWSQAVQATGKPTPYVGEILHAAFNQAQAVVVLMTPDDEVRLRESLRQQSDLPDEENFAFQARPNVLFEAGMAMGRNEGRTVLVEFGTLRPFSDVGGRHVIRFESTTQRRQELADCLRTAGCPVNLNGTDWHTAGDFTWMMQASTLIKLRREVQAASERQPVLEFGAPELLEHGTLRRTEIRGSIETPTGFSGPEHRVVVRQDKIRNWRIPITNRGAPIQEAKAKLVHASSPIDGVSGEITLHQAFDDPPLDNYTFRRTFSLDKDETILIDVVAMDEQKPEIWYLWNVAFEDAVQPVKLGGTRELTLRVYAGDVNFEEAYEIYGDASSARLDMKGPLRRPAQ